MRNASYVEGCMREPRSGRVMWNEATNAPNENLLGSRLCTKHPGMAWIHRFFETHDRRHVRPAGVLTACPVTPTAITCTKVRQGNNEQMVYACPPMSTSTKSTVLKSTEATGRGKVFQPSLDKELTKRNLPPINSDSILYGMKPSCPFTTTTAPPLTTAGTWMTITMTRLPHVFMCE